MRKLLIFLLPLSIYASDEKILSQTNQDILDTKSKTINEQKSIDQKSWLSNPTLNASLTKDEDDTKSKNLYLSYTQKIFNFGGIWYTIDLASIQKKYDLLDLQISYKEFINTIYSGVLDIKILNYQIQKTTLNIKNQAIKIDILKDEYKQGQANMSELNDAIIDKNTLQKSLVELEIDLQTSVQELKKTSDLNYEEIFVPEFKLKSENEYLKSSDKLNLAKQKTKIAAINRKITQTSFLPSLSFTLNGGYKKVEPTNDEYEKYYDYGLKLSMPIDFSFSNKLEKARLNELLSATQQTQTKIDEKVEYEKITQQIEKYKELNEIANDDIKLYDELLLTTQEEYQAGFKAHEDLEILTNTKSVRELDVKINDLYIKKMILGFYF